ncbi:MAG: hypothetical protein JWO80_4401, partial [Bryobacterales bacterium]|nr:hypothetical protein [Bryobacterales bacterium]
MKVLRALLLLFAAVAAYAHIGSPDVYFEGQAGPYRLYVTIRPPGVIPGVAEVDVRALSGDIRTIHIVPIPLTGPGANHPPTADVMQPSKEDPHFYTGSLWLMAFGSFQVRIDVDGAQGPGTLSVPIPAVASRISQMGKGLGVALFGAMVVLVLGLVSIVGASVRDSQLEPGVQPSAAQRRRAWIAMGATAAVLIGILYFGSRWWNDEAGQYRSHIYKPMDMAATRDGSHLTLKLASASFFQLRKSDDLIPDHNHLMHLFVIRVADMNMMWHLHPEMTDDGAFSTDLPSLPPGNYKLFADIVHADGFPETLATQLTVPAIAGRALSGDDSAGVFGQGLSGGYRMVWLHSDTPIRAKQPAALDFRVEDAAGRPAEDLQLYMGMPGHAEIVSKD